MTAHRGGAVVLTFSGEIYNSRQLREELRGFRPPVPHAIGHRDSAPGVPAVGCGLPAAPGGHVRLRGVGRGAAGARAGSRPARGETAVLRAVGDRLAVRIRAE